MAISLEKVIAPDSLRGIGSIRRGIEPHKLVSGGHRADLIAEALNGEAFAVGRTNARLAFYVQAADTYYLYAHRDYQGYRRFFRRFFEAIPPGCDVDHVLSRSLAARACVPYLLLAAIPKRVNRSHGSAERRGLDPDRAIFLGKTFPLDECMFDNVLGRRLGTRSWAREPRVGYRPGEGHAFGVSLTARMLEPLLLHRRGRGWPSTRTTAAATNLNRRNQATSSTVHHQN